MTFHVSVEFAGKIQSSDRHQPLPHIVFQQSHNRRVTILRGNKFLYRFFLLGVLNNKDVQGQICPGLDHSSKAPKSPSSKAAAVFTRGACASYVSTEKWRERRWRLFSTDPYLENILPDAFFDLKILGIEIWLWVGLLPIAIVAYGAAYAVTSLMYLVIRFRPSLLRPPSDMASNVR